jgi:hypothetical protein
MPRNEKSQRKERSRKEMDKVKGIRVKEKETNDKDKVKGTRVKRERVRRIKVKSQKKETVRGRITVKSKKKETVRGRTKSK